MKMTAAPYAYAATVSPIIGTASPVRTAGRLGQFKDLSTRVVLMPAEYKSGEIIYSYEKRKVPITRRAASQKKNEVAN